jgi:hypothetical protein
MWKRKVPMKNAQEVAKVEKRREDARALRKLRETGKRFHEFRT